ncbi:hypothetical protein CK203_050333 [Vitis vinifera]|uniref:Reverse transcriptase domain-containing protein n=1 Tax=Vitis vinifera TaxID=29760 RepID=A0A438GZX1_VITVI|nr:hypothetical protein CK203_050333 [Vitis vinifera]
MKLSILLKALLFKEDKYWMAVLIANEIVDEKRRSGEEGVVFKIDFEKAYDHTLKSLLLVFGHISGLKVNLDKSNIYDINLFFFDK